MTDSTEHSGAVKTPELDRDARWKQAASRAPVDPVPGDEPTRAAAFGSKLEADPDKSSYAGYLFGSSGTADRPAWSDSMQGRAAIRLFSRGVLGAGFFALGGHFAAKQLEGYESFKTLKELQPFNNGKPLQYVAKFWDTFAGKPIQWITYHVTPARGEVGAKALKIKADAVWDVTRFRNKTFNSWNSAMPIRKDRYGVAQFTNGRGLGAEIVSITFDFFMASIGDALGRNLVQSIDPNLKQPWYLDENGKATTRDKGRFDFNNWARSVGRASWRIFSKNAMEDWAAALPYVYHMKWQRQALAKWMPGFKLSSDHGWNGGVAAVATSGSRIGQVVGGYQLPGLIDLQLRFMSYNWFTLMYREMYDALGRGYSQWKDNHYQLSVPQIGNPVVAAFDGAGFMARYITKSAIKATMYMTLAVPFFWIFRTPQSKWRGGYVAEDLAKVGGASRENAFLTMKPYGLATGGDKDNPVFLENTTSDLYPRAQLIHDTRFHPVTGKGPKQVFFGNRHSLNSSQMNKDEKNIFTMRNPYEMGVKRNVIDHILNPFGALSYHTGSALTHAVDHFFPHANLLSPKLFDAKTVNGVMSAVEKNRVLLSREKLLRTFVDASFSYTPYMWAKAETALRVDDRRSTDELGHMDKAIYRFLDNGFTLNFKGAGQAFKEMTSLALNIEKDVKSREGNGSTHPAPVHGGGGDGTVVPRADNVVPHTRVEAGSVTHGRGESLAQAPEKDERRWAESVAGRKLDAQYVAPQTTLH